MGNKFDIKSNILAGNELRVLLNSDHISYGEIHNTMKKKGIFIGDSGKSITIPLLSSTLLTPDEFSHLIETSVSRESIPKNKTLSHELLADDVDWITPLKDIFEDQENGNKLIFGMDNILFVDYPDVVVEDKNKIRINYKVNRKDYSKDWIERELNFSGDITIEHVGNKLKLDLLTTHSSKETEKINKKITSQISKKLHNLNIVKSESPNIITFNSFTNEERVRFFKRLTAGKPKNLSIGTVDNIEINLDPNGPSIPNDPKISWMDKTVKRVKIDGERLNDIFLISDEKYYIYFHIQKMDIEFEFSFGQNSGKCKVSFSFSTLSKRNGKIENSEFIFSCSRVKVDNTTNADAKRTIENKINMCLKKLIEEKFDEILSERKEG
ncbi:GapS4b family protein [Photorhabdus akhurstii]|uniref:GapS4b family protein n=1 Tax=Photorhabdus akhurstii TaxID=171438 RepID=UPI000D4FF854|nr:hypothetical protein [Photorhabdus akhurstii]MBS9429351.1 hypothetical protein [Photorhabdus akhurstii]PQQ42442.1 hypothetical protein C6H65_03210 [Photorhabdus luminescens]